MKKVYLVKVPECGWDEYDSIIVVASTEEEAISMGEGFFEKHQGQITATEVNLTKSGVILTSFNAG